MVTSKQLAKKFLDAAAILEGYDGSKAADLRNEVVREVTKLATAYDIKKGNLEMKRAQATPKGRGAYSEQLADLKAKFERDKAAKYRDWTKKANDAIAERRKGS